MDSFTTLLHVVPFSPSGLLPSPSHNRVLVMRSRNEILADIVLSIGGTITDPSNRNQLLRDWLAAI